MLGKRMEPGPVQSTLVPVLALTAGGLLLLTGTASAAVVIYDNGIGGATGINQGANSDPSAAVPDTRADQFSTSMSGTVESVRWTGIYFGADTPPLTDVFSITFYSDSGGLPDGTLGTFPVGNSAARSDSLSDVGGRDVYDYLATVNFPVTAGTTYWLSVVNDTTTDADDVWQWGVLIPQGDSARRTTGNWTAIPGIDFDFTLNGVPEPSSATLVCLGLIAWLAPRRRGG